MNNTSPRLTPMDAEARGIHGSTIGRPFAVDATEGCYLLQADGRRILDAAGGAIVSNVGHGCRRVVDAAARSMYRSSYVLPPFQHPDKELLMAELRSHWLPPELDRIYLTPGGSEGNELAMRFAFLYHSARGDKGRVKIISREPSYHGATTMAMAVSQHAARRHGLESALPGHPHVPAPYGLRCPLGRNHPDACEHYVEALRTTIEREGPETIAALLVEPIVGASGGALLPPEGYWLKVRELCDHYGILLISDEVMTGFGRVGIRFACERWHLIPDIMVGGKGLAGGYGALAGVYLKGEILDTLTAAGFGPMFHTFAAMPAACAAATEVLRILREENLVAAAQQKGALLGECLQEHLGQHPFVAEARGLGLLWAVEIVANRETLEPFPLTARITDRVIAEGLRRGVSYYCGGTGKFRDIICMGPAFIITEAEIEHCVSVLTQSIDAVLDGFSRD